MNTGAISTGTSEVQASAAVKVAAMGLDAMRQQGNDVSKLMQQSQVASDPAVGQNLDVLA
jgi:TPP-dependent pyruvate/acetoin dehydrogenase alpha subunit